MFVKSLFKLKCTTFSIPLHCIGLSNMKHAFTQVIPVISINPGETDRVIITAHVLRGRSRASSSVRSWCLSRPQSSADFWPALWSSALPHSQQEPTALWRGGPPTTGDTVSPLPQQEAFHKVWPRVATSIDRSTNIRLSDSPPPWSLWKKRELSKFQNFQ